MDPITHGLLGGVAVGACQSKTLQRPLIVAGILGAMAPDLDFLIQSRANPLLFLEYHRHFTHALGFVPLGGLCVGFLLWLLYRRRISFTSMWLATSLGFLTHCLLDACTSYGTQLFWPLSRERIAWDFISIVDPIYTMILLIGLIWAWRSRFRGVARLALLLATAYLGLGVWQHHNCQAWQQRLAMERGHTIEAARVLPSLGNILLWRSVYRNGNRFYVDALRMPPHWNWRLYSGSSQQAFQMNEVVPIPPPRSTLRQDLELIEWFSQNFLGVVSRNPWVLGDLRLAGLPSSVQPIFGFKFNPQQSQQHVQRARFNTTNDADLQTFWQMLQGEDLK